ncbi:MAG TPA: ABC transporter permease [Thermomicrobiales bacterium]|nr:ABC transporter permease [Thermomicrobiales bacterium]
MTSRAELAGSAGGTRRGRRFWFSAISPNSKYYWVRLVAENPAAVVSAIVLLVIVLGAIFAPMIAPFDPNYVNPADRLSEPSGTYWFGTDDLGRDIYSRVVYGARISLLVGIAVMIGATAIGAALGLVAGYYPRVDTPLMRVMDGLEAFPSILLAIAIMAAFGAAIENVILALSFVYAPNIVRLVRGTTLMNSRELYVESARVIGMGDWLIMWKYILRNSLSPLIVQATFVVAFAILAEASLSFLGAGVPQDVPTWGGMVSAGQARLQQAWWASVFPGIFLFITVLAINLIGDALRDALDPRTRKR